MLGQQLFPQLFNSSTADVMLRFLEVTPFTKDWRMILFTLRIKCDDLKLDIYTV